MPARTRHLPMLALAAGAALTMTGCIIMPPALPTAAPAQPSAPPSAEPTPTDGAEPTESTAPSPSADSGDLPEYVDFGTALEPGTLAGWETSILTDSAFTVQPDSDFPIGPTISVVETATGCSFWAYQGMPDSDSTDEEESSLATLTAFLGGSAPESTDLVDLGPSSSQGTTVVFLSTVREGDAGATEVYYARNFQSSQSTSAIRGTCPAGAGDLESIDEVVFEHFQINFLAP